MEIAILPDKLAFVTLVTSDDFVDSAGLLLYSLRMHSPTLQCHKVVMVPPLLSENSRVLLKKYGYSVLEVPSIPNPNTGVHVKSWVEVGFTKLRLWSLTQFTAVIYIDADCLVVVDIADLVSRAAVVNFAAGPDTFPPDNFNAGVMIVRPDLNVFERMLRRMPNVESYDGGDTGFLNEFFPDWYSSSPAARLPFGFNALRTMQWFTKAKPSYWDSIEPLKIIHFCSSPKPWEHEKDVGGPLEKLWWKWFEKWQQTLDDGDHELKMETLPPLPPTPSPTNASPIRPSTWP
eukprot:86715_1